MSLFGGGFAYKTRLLHIGKPWFPCYSISTRRCERYGGQPLPGSSASVEGLSLLKSNGWEEVTEMKIIEILKFLFEVLRALDTALSLRDKIKKSRQKSKQRETNNPAK